MTIAASRFQQYGNRRFLILLAIGVALLALVPIYATPFLPINDYPFHLARMVILSHLDDPVFGRFYGLGTFLLPDVGMDAVTIPLSHLFGPERATLIFVGITLMSMLFGAVALHWVPHRPM